MYVELKSPADINKFSKRKERHRNKFANMNPDVCHGSRMLFQMLSSDLDASLATADELSREFDSLMKECSSNTESLHDTGSGSSKELQPTFLSTSSPPPSRKADAQDQGTSSPRPLSDDQTPLNTVTGPPSPNLFAQNGKSFLLSPSFSPAGQLTPPMSRKSPLSSSCGLQSLPQHSPQTRKRVFQFDSIPRDRTGSPRLERRSSPCPSPLTLDQTFLIKSHPTPGPMPPHPSSPSWSPRPERRPVPHPLVQSAPSNLPRSLGPQSPAASPPGSEVGMRRQKLPAEWTENNGELIYGQKPQIAYEKAERLRAYGSLDSRPAVSSTKFQPKASLPRNMRLNPERSSSPSSSSSMSRSPYGSPSISRKFCASPTPPRSHWHQPVPLSIIMRTQKPLGSLITRHPRVMDLEGDGTPHLQSAVLQQHLLQSARQGSEKGMEKEEGDPWAFSQPQSPACLPTLAPGCPELMLLRSEIPRALKKRGGLSQPVPQVHHRQYQQMIRKLFSRNGLHNSGELGSGSSSSSEGEEGPKAPAAPPRIPMLVTSQRKSILKRPRRDRKSPGQRARLSPLVILLDGAMVGDLDAVQKAAKEMSDPSQPNDEGITALHNAVCGGHNKIVDFLVQIGANISAQDCYGWTPLHCAAACNNRSMCEYLVRNGAAVLSVTDGDGATAIQKCDPFAAGFEECMSFLKGVEEAMGVENSRVLYALWGYPAQAPDELSFREGDTVIIKKKQEGAEWWWASHGNKEGFVPSNYFALFPKVRPRSVAEQNQKGR
ncbi:hypothetical protein GJAV_G00132290 [Gymnothorax javanicus]|nr:hypothetical protein GJAV_G00132290 [Gymnothorax javanicus]